MPDTPPTSPEDRQIVLSKSGETFIIRYVPGDEAFVLDHLVEMVNRPDPRFDWFDAGVMSHQLGKAIAADLKARHAGLKTGK